MKAIIQHHPSRARPGWISQASVLLPSFVAAAFCSAQTAFPQQATPPDPPAKQTELDSRTLKWWAQDVTVFRSHTTRLTPEQRVEDALRRLDRASGTLLTQPVTSEPTLLDEERGYRFLVGSNYLFTLLESDLDELAGSSLDETRDAVLSLMGEIRRARIRSEKPIARAALYTAAATVGAILGIVFLLMTSRTLSAVIDRTLARWTWLRVARADLRPHLGTLVRQMIGAVCFLAGIYLACAYLAFIMAQFPLTAPWGLAFETQLLRVAHNVVLSIAHAIPGLIIAVVILAVTRWLTTLLASLIESVGSNTIHSIMSPETARATRRLVVAAVWVFGVVLAIPHLPGSGSEAFKGVSVLLGLMVSLGSAGMINQVMSGFVLLYSGSVRTGEYVQVGETEGRIIEIGVLAVKLLTPKREFITIPNAIMLSHSTTNFSRLADRVGVPISTQVSIGYDAPWRLVHALLLKAAEETEGVIETPEPKVTQKALGDWYPEYLLTCYAREPEDRIEILSALNAKVQDVFNEAGVQIMSPHFRDQPKAPVLVPKDRWFPSLPSRIGKAPERPKDPK